MKASDYTDTCTFGDVREVLRRMIAAGVQVNTIVTSPPYWGLRSYLAADHPDKPFEIGSEPTLAEFLATMVEVFDLCRQVLRDDGTCWVNMGDSYAGSRGAPWGPSPKSTEARSMTASRRRDDHSIPRSDVRIDGLKPKDLVGQPWRVAFALQQPRYLGQIKDECDRVWLAAMIDGEGCFFIHKRKAGTRSGSKFTRADGTEVNYERTADTYGVGLEVCNTSRAIVERAQAIVGGGTITSQTPEQNPGRKQTIHRWRVQPNEAKRIAQEVYPHLVAKQQQARLIFNCPSSGAPGAAAHAALIGLHRGIATDVDYPAPPSLFAPGWYLRQDIVWSKKNPMPESTRDRCTKAHEYLFLLSKNERYFYDFEAVREPVGGTAHPRRAEVKVPYGWATGDTPHTASEHQQEGRHPKYGALTGGNHDGAHRTKAGLNLDRGTKNNTSMDDALADMRSMRNRRSVWTVASEPYSGAHFATFPRKLIEHPILAGAPAGGIVLDPFFGSGTTGQVAQALGRRYIGIDLNRANEPLQAERLRQPSLELEAA